MPKRFEVTSRALFEAAASGDVKFLQKTLNCPTCTSELVNDQTQNEFGNSALMEASYMGHVEAVNLLLAHDEIKVNLLDKYGNTALHIAAYGGHEEVVAALLQHDDTDVNVVNDLKRTALLAACIEQKRDCAHTLIRYNADLRWYDKDENTALHIACKNGDEAIVRNLLKYPNDLDIDVGNKDGCTPLHQAASKGHIAIVKALLECTNIDVNLKDSLHRTPLFAAAIAGHAGVVEELLSHDDIYCNMADDDGTTPLHIACEEGHDKVVQVLLKHPRIVVNRGDAKSMSPLEHAVRGGYTRIVKLLLSRPYIEVIQEKFMLSDVACSNKVRAYLQYFEHPPGAWKPLFSWIAVHLLDYGLDVRLVRDCEEDLVLREGFVVERDFAEVPTSELTAAYLARIGVTGKGVQMRLLKLHKELQAKYGDAQSCDAGTTCVMEAEAGTASDAVLPTRTAPVVVAAAPTASVLTHAAEVAPAVPAPVPAALPATATLPTAEDTTVDAPTTSAAASATAAPIRASARLRVPVHALIPAPAASTARMRSDTDTLDIIATVSGSTGISNEAAQKVMSESARAHLVELRDQVDAALAKYAGTATAVTSTTTALDSIVRAPPAAKSASARNKRKMATSSDLESASDESDGNEESSISAYDTNYRREKPKRVKTAAKSSRRRK